MATLWSRYGHAPLLIGRMESEAMTVENLWERPAKMTALVSVQRGSQYALVSDQNWHEEVSHIAYISAPMPGGAANV
eukprot:1949741-Rhodomonas_salina.3